MVVRGKSINLFFMGGTPNGCIKCRLINWTGIDYKNNAICTEIDDSKYKEYRVENMSE